ncbi:hypothetical protein WJX79_010731 [Trebouxia sp. C0005]
MTRKMVVPGREEMLFNDLLAARHKRDVLKALKDEKSRVAALEHIVPEESQLQDVDDLWDFLLLHTCQVTSAQKDHFTSVLRDASSFVEGSSFQKSEDVCEPDWYSDVQTKAGYCSKVDMPAPDGSDCPRYTNREENQFQVLHKVHVYDKDCWSEWNMVRKPDDSRGQPNARAKLYTDLMTARKASAVHQVQMAVDAMKAELSIIHRLPEQERSSCDFTDGQDVYRWINVQAHQITAEQKRHLAAILQAAIELKLSVEGRPVQVCVLGVSHVSRQSCSHVAQIIAAISPEAVLLELCKDRVELLLDPSASPPQHWHTRAIDLQGMSQSSKSACKKLLFKLTCQHGSAFTAHDIEEDCVQLLASGAFESVVPMTQPASMRDAPFFVPGTHQMHPAAPLGSLQFQKLLMKLASRGWRAVPHQARAGASNLLSPEERQQIGTSFEPTQWRPWSQQEMDASQASISGRLDAHPSGAVNPFTSFVTQTYAKYQREAGEAVGVASGETWRTAFHAAAQHGASQVHLGDKPAIAMSQQMSQGIWNGTAPYLGAALFLALATLASSATHVLPSALLPVATAVSLGVLSKGLYSVLSPLVEIRQLSRLSPQQIEEAVDLKEPLQNGSKQLVRLWGEDALLSWPGALEPVIHERDVHMAKTIWAAATDCGMNLSV